MGEVKRMCVSYGWCLNRTWGCKVGPSARGITNTVIPLLPDPAGRNCCELNILMKVTLKKETEATVFNTLWTGDEDFRF
jgi:hypothetical protein